MYRIGQAQDIHPLKKGRPLYLGGVLIPYEYGLDGHSDADVVLHALAEAILGALALGDLGTYFPDHDECYHNLDSMIILAKAIELMEERHFQINNIDLSIIAEAPKLAPYLPRMRSRIAEGCHCSLDDVSLKAGTNEKMDAVGEKKAIIAQCVVLLKHQ